MNMNSLILEIENQIKSIIKRTQVQCNDYLIGRQISGSQVVTNLFVNEYAKDRESFSN
jgi:hypothetical protein